MNPKARMRRAWLLAVIISPSVAPKRRLMILGSIHTRMQMTATETVMKRNDLTNRKRKALLSPLPTWIAPSDCMVRQTPAMKRL